MIYPATTLLLATLVFNAASVLGAPVRIPPPSQLAAREATDAPVLPRKTVDVSPSQRSVDDVPIDSRSVVNRAIASENDVRDIASAPDTVEARNPLPEVEAITRRYPRRVYHDFYQKRSQPAPPLDARSPSPEPDTSGQVERRYPRRALYERHEARSEDPNSIVGAPPAAVSTTSSGQPPHGKKPRAPTPLTREAVVLRSNDVEARSESAVAPPVERRYPRRVYAEHYEKRSTTPPPTVEARQEEAPPVERRFPRAVYAEHYKRQDGTPAGDAATPTSTNTPVVAAATPSPAPATNTTAPVAPAIVLPVTLNGTSPAIDWNKIVADITDGNKQGFQPGTTIKETTLLVNKVIHVSEPIKDVPVAAAPAACSPAAASCPPTGSTPVSPSPAASTPSATTTPATGTPGDGAPAASASPSAAATGTPGDGAPAASPSAATGDPTAKVARAPPEDPESRRSLGSEQASPEPILRRSTLGYSGPAWASYAKRSVN